jgi:hypothetical protein
MVHQLRRTGGTVVVALTSAHNEAYVRETRLYERTITYGAIETLAASPRTAYVDFLGRDDVTAAVHRVLGRALNRSILIGATDWSDKPGGIQAPRQEVVGPTPEFFFVPSYAAGRLRAQPELGKAMLRDLRGFYAASREFVTARRARGAAAVLETWQRLVAGEASPREGFVLSL